MHKRPPFTALGFILIYTAILMLLALPPLPLTALDRKIHTLFNSLAPHSVSQNLAFYELYPDTQEGQLALKRIRNLLQADASEFLLPPFAVDGMISLVNKQPSQDLPKLSDAQLSTLEKIAGRLTNRRLKGYHAVTEHDVIALPPEEIDIARSVILTQEHNEDFSPEKKRSYEAMIDFMALQIAASLPQRATPEQKIRAINHFIFEEMGFRFPPHSKHAKDIDLYTFLPSVLDSRHGVCLGVSILYLAVAQRLDLPLEVVTPPGHIYIRYHNGDKIINIETTARGIHIDCKDYLGVETKALQTRTIKEVIGLTHINHAAAYLKDEDYGEALRCYRKAIPYLTDNQQLLELMGYCLLLTGEEEKGRELLEKIADLCPYYALTAGTLAKDYLSNRADVQSIKTIFMSVDENRKSILKKKEALEQTVTLHPLFREGWHSLAVTWLQLHRPKEALAALEKCHLLDPTDPSVEYYLAALYSTRWNYPKAWEHLKNAERLVQAKNHHPKALQSLRRELSMTVPEGRKV